MKILIKDICSRYTNKRAIYQKKQQKIDASIIKAEQYLSNLREKQRVLSNNFPSWVDQIIVPIARAVNVLLPDRDHYILGPFGLSSMVSIHFCKKGVDEKDMFQNNNCVSITFRPDDLDKGEIEIIDYSTDTGKYAKKRIGEINHPGIPIPNDADIQWLVDFMVKQNLQDRIDSAMKGGE